MLNPYRELAERAVVALHHRNYHGSDFADCRLAPCKSWHEIEAATPTRPPSDGLPKVAGKQPAIQQPDTLWRIVHGHEVLDAKGRWVHWSKSCTGDYYETREAAEAAVRQFAEREAAATIGPQRAAPSSVAKIQAETKQAAAELATQEPAGRELPDGPGFWQRYGEKWVIRQHTESMFFGCLCDAKGYLGRTVAVLPKGGWRRADAGDASELREEVERLKDIEAYLNARLCELSREYNNYQITSNTKYDALQAQYDALLEGSE